MTAEHLATYETAGTAAVRAHLCAEHATAVWVLYGMSPNDVPFPDAVHRHLTSLIHARLASPAEAES